LLLLPGHREDSPVVNGSQNADRSQAKRRLALVLLGGLAGVTVGLAGIYGIKRLTGNAVIQAECRGAAELARRIAPLIRGEVAALAPATSPKLLPPLGFLDAAGARHTLAEWRGRTVLLNLWATWCVPCRKEMPALDALQAKLGGPGFEVVAINIDTRNPERPKAWLKEVGVTRLAYYADPAAKVFQDLREVGKAFGMPTTILIDGAGCEVATLNGPAEWASEDAVGVVSAALGR
jgi:thiol-disulfide isomerase/thioredoxin